MDCKALQVEIAKEIEQTGEFDVSTVLGFLGDLGIGNGIAKGEARKKADNRLNQLKASNRIKCTSE